MKVIIIGSKGFIGQNILNYYISKNEEVWGADIIIDSLADRYIKIDELNPDFEVIFQNIEYDLCINCSGAASVPESIKYPLRDYYLNTVNVIKQGAMNCHLYVLT